MANKRQRKKRIKAINSFGKKVDRFAKKTFKLKTKQGALEKAIKSINKEWRNYKKIKGQYEKARTKYDIQDRNYITMMEKLRAAEENEKRIKSYKKAKKDLAFLEGMESNQNVMTAEQMEKYQNKYNKIKENQEYYEASVENFESEHEYEIMQNMYDRDLDAGEQWALIKKYHDYLNDGLITPPAYSDKYEQAEWFYEYHLTPAAMKRLTKEAAKKNAELDKKMAAREATLKAKREEQFKIFEEAGMA